MNSPAILREMADFEIDESVVLNWLVREEEIDIFASLSGDFNPLHMSDEFAESKGFGSRVAHGFLLGAKVSALVGMFLPGQNCLILEQNISFIKAIFPRDDIAIEGKIAKIWESQNIVLVKIRAVRIDNENPVVVARGTVLCRNQ